MVKIFFMPYKINYLNFSKKNAFLFSTILTKYYLLKIFKKIIAKARYTSVNKYNLE